MKLKYMWLALTALCMASCSEEETIVSDASQREVRVTAGASTGSRMVLSDQETHYDALWQPGDQISLFTSTQSNLVYGTTIGENTVNATFTPADEALEYREGNTVYACYPSTTKHSEEGMVVNLPATDVMDYNDGKLRSFAYAVGTISDGSVSFQFKHTSAFLCLSVTPEMLADASKGSNCVKVSTSSSDPLSVGEGDTFDFLTQTINTTNGSNTVQINVDNHVVDSLWTVYIPILPQPGGADITVTLTDSEGQTLYTQTKQTPESGFVAGRAYHQKAVEVADVAYLVDGMTFNALIKQLAHGAPLGYRYIDELIQRIEFVGESSVVPADYIVVSTEASPVPIYASFNPVDSLLTISTAAKRMEIVDASYMFCGCSSLESLDLSSFDTSNVTDMRSMFYNCSSLLSLDLSGFDTSNVTTMKDMFSGCSFLEGLDLSSFDTSNVTDMNQMFLDCSSLSSLDLSSFDTSNVTYMYTMFGRCSSLFSLDLSSFDTSNVTDMNQMFGDCSSLSSLDLSSFDTSNVTDMRFMFGGCSSLSSLDLSSFDTSNVTDLSVMFYSCFSLSSLDLSSFDTFNVTDMNQMFSACSSLENLDLSSFDTSNVTDMHNMFSGCSSLSILDLSSFDTSNVTDLRSMFENCSSLSILNLSNFDTSNATLINSMFENCASTSKACRVTCTQDLKDFLLARTTGMNPDWFIWGDEESDTFSIVGTWEMIEGDMDEWTIIFKEDGTGIDSWTDEGEQDEYEFTYSLDWENRKLYTQVSGEEPIEWEIVAYSDTEVTLRYSFDGGTVEYVFRKV